MSLKTASLLADACRSTVILWGETSDSPTSNAAWDYGHNLGIAYQISNDIIAYNTIIGQLIGTSEATHPPASSEGIAAEEMKVEAMMKILELPVYSLAAEYEPELSTLAIRSFSSPGDAEMAMKLIDSGDGPKRALALAQEYVDVAREATTRLPPSAFRDGLEVMSEYIIEEDQIGLQRQEYIDLKSGKNP